MGTPTYTLIQEQILGSSTATVTFSSIPQTYKDLIFESVGNGGVAYNGYGTVTFNSDNSSNYSRTYIQGSGAAAGTGRTTSGTYMFWIFGSADAAGLGVYQIMSYSNTSINKTVLQRWSGAASSSVGSGIQVDLWRSTSAINRIDITSSGTSFVSGTTFRLWGIVG